MIRNPVCVSMGKVNCFPDFYEPQISNHGFTL